MGSLDTMQWLIGSVKNVAHTLMSSSGQNLNCTWAGIIHYGLSFAFQIQNNCFFVFVSSFTRSIVLYSTTLFSNFHKLKSVSFQMLPRICISLLQGLNYRQLDLGMSFLVIKKKKCYPNAHNY